MARSLLDGLPPGGFRSDPEYGEAILGSDVHINLGSETRREIEPTFFFMLNCLLYSRLEKGYPSNQDFYDEDVNVYLANLLCSFMKPEYHKRSRPYLSPYDSTLFEKVANSTDARLKYTIYKTNADFLLHILARLSEGDVYHLERSVDPTRATRELSALRDEFLDLYSDYLRTMNPELRTRVEALAKKIHSLDDSFEFHIDR